MDSEDKIRIRNLLFKRVGDPQARAKIYQLAHTFAEGDDESDTYWSCMYHYALEENWGDLERDYRQFVAGKISIPENSKKTNGASSGKE
jgi:hypothetical protein